MVTMSVGLPQLKRLAKFLIDSNINYPEARFSLTQNFFTSSSFMQQMVMSGVGLKTLVKCSQPRIEMILYIKDGLYNFLCVKFLNSIYIQEIISCQAEIRKIDSKGRA